MLKKPTMLIILDGYGIGEDYPGNAVKLANTPNIDKLMKDYPNTSLEASGLAVGLPPGQMGNSEVGHLNIGSGRVIYQELTRISKEIEDKDFFEKQEFLTMIENAREKNKRIHLLGLVSSGGVHSHSSHLFALLELMKMRNFNDVYVHAILDGRDVAPTSGKEDIQDLIFDMKKIGVGKLASVSGRYYSMDRDKRWDRTRMAYDAMVLGQGQKTTDPVKAIENSYKDGVTDEFFLPTVVMDHEKPLALVEEDDSILFFNFRPDRARQITRAFLDEDFEGFQRLKRVHTFYLTMTEYDKTIKNVEIAYRNNAPINTLGEYISKQGLNQLRAAETEKYGHVTFFFNGGIEEPYANEDRVLIPSPKVATYNLQPEMSAEPLKDEILKRLDMDKYDLIVLNFANADMVGHTGSIPATIKAVETVDRCLGEIVEKLLEKNGKALVTADHGNAERLRDEIDNSIITAHTTNKVPLIFVGGKGKLKEGILADIAPTILDIMKLDQPKEMTGVSLIERS